MSKFEKGNKIGKGRPVNSQNKSTKEVREFFNEFLQRNASKLDEGFMKIYEQDPYKALDILLKASEYVIPKLGRIDQQVTIKDKSAVTPEQAARILAIHSKKDENNS